MSGLTGIIKFDQHGLRTGCELNIIEMDQKNQCLDGKRRSEHVTNFHRNLYRNSGKFKKQNDDCNNYYGIHISFFVTQYDSFGFQSPPYSMVTQSQERLTGNDAFEGFAIDLIAEIAEILSKSNLHLDGWNENLCFY